MTGQSAPIFQIKVTLDDTRPPVWRRIQVSGNTTLFKLHQILQAVMGWQDYHLHQFTIDDAYYGDPADDEFGDLGIQPETRYKLSQLVPGEGFRFRYEYDFGDGWEHICLVEKILPPEEGVRYPVCLKGKRACPPEDVGGVWGYQGFLEAIGDPAHPEHDEYLTWVGGDFDPEAFDLEAANARLRRMGRGAGAASAWSLEEELSGEDRTSRVIAWAEGLPGDQRAEAENLPLRRDLVALLTYLRENRVTGTQSTGNLPLKAVRELSALFVNPPPLEQVIGSYAFRVRSESDVWPLYFRHVLAAFGGLVAGGPARRWRLTPSGERFLTLPAPLQVSLLLDTWWTQVDWAIALARGSYDIPHRFRAFALEHLLGLAPNSPAPFEAFADRLIEQAGLVWLSRDQTHVGLILRALVEHTVIGPMIDFGVLTAAYQPHKVLGARAREIATFEVTSWGRSLLQSLRLAI